MSNNQVYQDAIALCFDGRKKKRLLQAYQCHDSLYGCLGKCDNYRVLGAYMAQLCDSDKVDVMVEFDTAPRVLAMVADYCMAVAEVSGNEQAVLKTQHGQRVINFITNQLSYYLSCYPEPIEQALDSYCHDYLLNPEGDILCP